MSKSLCIASDRRDTAQPEPYIHHARDQNALIVSLPAVCGRKPKQFSLQGISDDLAWEKAIRYRDRRLPATHKVRIRSHKARGSNRLSTYGVIHRQKTALGRSGVFVRKASITAPTQSHAVIASCHDGNGEPHYQAVSVKRYGFEQALRNAIRQRLGWERQYLAHRSKLSVDDWTEFCLAFYAQFQGQKAPLEDMQHPGAISEHPTGVQARLGVAGETHSAWFAHRTYASSHESRVAAILWLRRTYDKNKRSPQKIRRAITKANKTTDRLGVSRRIIRDGRNKAETVVYEASVQINGRGYPIRFRAGRLSVVTPEQERVAYAAACDCRAQYEADHAAGRDFDRKRWQGWKKRYAFPGAS